MTSLQCQLSLRDCSYHLGSSTTFNINTYNLIILRSIKGVPTHL